MTRQIATTITLLPRCRLRPRLEALALQPLALQFAGAPHGFCCLPGTPLRRLFIMTTQFHFPEDSFALHFLLQRLQGLIDIVVADNDLH